MQPLLPGGQPDHAPQAQQPVVVQQSTSRDGCCQRQTATMTITNRAYLSQRVRAPTTLPPHRPCGLGSGSTGDWLRRGLPTEMRRARQPSRKPLTVVLCVRERSSRTLCSTRERRRTTQESMQLVGRAQARGPPFRLPCPCRAFPSPAQLPARAELSMEAATSMPRITRLMTVLCTDQGTLQANSRETVNAATTPERERGRMSWQA